jgi:hypothetical protein
MPKLNLIEHINDDSSIFCGYTGSPIGWWSVQTEGDVEGRTVCNLGTYFGHIAEIAFGLGKSPFYSYHFNPVKNTEPYTQPLNEYGPWVIRRRKVDIQLWVDSWGYVKTTKGLGELGRWFDTSDILVERSNYYGCFEISLKDTI